MDVFCSVIHSHLKHYKNQPLALKREQWHFFVMLTCFIQFLQKFSQRCCRFLRLWSVPTARGENNYSVIGNDTLSEAAWTTNLLKWCPHSYEVKQSVLGRLFFCLFSVWDELNMFRTDYLKCLLLHNWLTAVYNMQTVTKWDYRVSAECEVCFPAVLCGLDCSNYERSRLNSYPSLCWQVVHAFGTNVSGAGSLISSKWVQDSEIVFILCGWAINFIHGSSSNLIKYSQKMLFFKNHNRLHCGKSQTC